MTGATIVDVIETNEALGTVRVLRARVTMDEARAVARAFCPPGAEHTRRSFWSLSARPVGGSIHDDVQLVRGTA